MEEFNNLDPVLLARTISGESGDKRVNPLMCKTAKWSDIL